MISKDIKKLIGPLAAPLYLEDIVLHKHRRSAQKFFAFVAILSLAALATFPGEYVLPLKAALFISLGLYFTSLMLEGYFYSFYERSHENPDILPFEIAEMLYYCDGRDLVEGFLFSDIGDRTMKKLGLSEKDIKEFLHVKTKVNFSWQSVTERPGTVALYADLMQKTDKDWADFLFKKGITNDVFIGAFEWTIEEERKIIEEERVWSKEHLLRIPALGKNWSYGQTFILEKYGADATEEVGSFLPSYESAHDENVRELESILSKSSGANCIITSDDESSRLDVVLMLATRIRRQEVLSPLTHGRIFILNPNLIIENSNDKITFERAFSDVLSQAIAASNIILVIPYLSSFIKSASALGSDVVALLLPYLESPLLHIVGLDGKDAFHSELESNATLLEHFQILKIDIGSGEGVMAMLEKQAEEIEKESKLFITYTALVSILESSRRYFDGSSYAEKAKDLLLEAVPYCFSHGSKVLLPEHISAIVSERTGVPTGTPKGEEKDKLLNLEKILHARVIGQEEAIKAISEAMRRSRAGVGSPNKPIGSFLFLGPTGVGKTETTKALAEVFFGSEGAMSRLDMSEYKGPDALGRLLGSFDANKAGILATTVREKPYAVLLLDEFEKSNPDALNLFLQVLDEGVFSDANGKKVNVRNNIIIATSNAGSDMIWKFVKDGADMASKKEEIIDALISEGIFKPELLNRFDAVILFHPLGDTELAQIARLMMQKFAKRMTEKGIDILIDDKIINFLVSKGTDPKFGARPMNRAIDDEVEGLVASKIISGDITKGSHVSFDIEGDSVLKITVK